MAEYDLTIIGGGINGTAIARDAAGRGLRVLLLEQHDLGSGTSWASSKLIHGGLRYLEQGAFKLVREGLKERALLLRSAPHIIWPARFVLPHHKALRPAWMLRLGLFLYDFLGGDKTLPTTQRVDLKKDEAGNPLKPEYKTGFEYSDCQVDDARLVVLNALDAAEHGAVIRTRTCFERAERQGTAWQIFFTDGKIKTHCTSLALINASGPWVERVNNTMPADVQRSNVKLIAGSHIVVRKLFTHAKSYIFQNADGRIVFALPFEDDFTLIGTTDVPFEGNPEDIKATDAEIEYLCKLAGNYFKKPLTPSDVVWHFSGIRALYDNRSLDAKSLSRDYFLGLDAEQGKPPLLSIYGGKLTAARIVAEQALDKLAPFLPMNAAWTGTATLPGGDFAWHDFEKQLSQVRARWSFLSETHARRLFRAYGTRIEKILGHAKDMEDLGAHFGADLTEAEVRYLMQHEWARSADDVLWLRSKLGLRFTPAQKQALDTFIKNEGIQA